MFNHINFVYTVLLLFTQCYCDIVIVISNDKLRCWDMLPLWEHADCYCDTAVRCSDVAVIISNDNFFSWDSCHNYVQWQSLLSRHSCQFEDWHIVFCWDIAVNLRINRLLLRQLSMCWLTHSLLLRHSYYKQWHKLCCCDIAILNNVILT